MLSRKSAQRRQTNTGTDVSGLGFLCRQSRHGPTSCLNHLFVTPSKTCSGSEADARTLDLQSNCDWKLLPTYIPPEGVQALGNRAPMGKFKTYPCPFKGTGSTMSEHWVASPFSSPKRVMRQIY